MNPKGEDAAGLAKYLINNRRHGTYWNSTRDSAVVIEALADYMQASGEAEPDLEVEILVDGKRQKAVHITAKDLFWFDNRLILKGDVLSGGQHRIEIKKKGRGICITISTLPISRWRILSPRPASRSALNESTICSRRSWRNVCGGARGQVAAERTEKYQRTEIPNLGAVTSGDLVEIELEIESKNDYEYLVFEDMKPAGFEPVEVQSGYNGNELGAYVEFRDEKVAFFAAGLARGRHSVTYRMKAEIRENSVRCRPGGTACMRLSLRPMRMRLR